MGLQYTARSRATRTRMLKAGWIPTPLIADEQRPGVAIVQSRRPGRVAALATIGRLSWWVVTLL